jgi:hypothetical protein
MQGQNTNYTKSLEKKLDPLPPFILVAVRLLEREEKILGFFHKLKIRLEDFPPLSHRDMPHTSSFGPKG